MKIIKIICLIFFVFTFTGCVSKNTVNPVLDLKGKVLVDEKIIVDKEFEAPISGVELIGKYYSFFWTDELEKAYEMKFEPDGDFQTFENLYKNTFRAEPYDFEQVGINKYHFFVDYFDDDGKNERYEVEMEIINGKLKTIYSKLVVEKMLDEELIFDSSLRAFVEWSNGNTYLYISKDEGTTWIADSITKRNDWSDKFAKFFNLKFSKNGRYLIYSMTAWETIVFKVYDVQEKKIIYNIGIAGGILDISDDENYMFECEGTGMSGGLIRIYSLPDLKLKADLFSDYAKDFMAGGCKYDSEFNTLHYSLIEYGQEKEIWKDFLMND